MIFGLLGVFLMAISLPYVGVAFYFFIPLVAGFYRVAMSDYVNKHVETSHRATILSVKNLFSSLGVFLLFPLVGYFAESSSFRIK